MMNRRTALSALGLATTAPWLCGAAWAARSPHRHSQDAVLPPLPTASLTVWDHRCADRVAPAFSHALHSRHAQGRHCTLSGDVSAAWFRTLAPHIHAGGTAMQGVTQGDALFCLQRLAADQGWYLQVLTPWPHRPEVGPGATATPHLAPAPWATPVVADDRVYAWTLAPRARA